MNETFKFGGVLAIVMLIAAGSLAYVDSVTKPRILVQREKNLTAGVLAVLPGSESGVILSEKTKEGLSYFSGYARPDTSEMIGYALPVIAKGYSSDIRTLVGFDTSGKIIAMKILFQQETPGLGTRVEETRRGESEPWFQAQFRDKNALEVGVNKDGGQIQSITGATITSRAVTDGVRIASKRFFDEITAKMTRNRE
jgi:electron transport complex protein RnfG